MTAGGARVLGVKMAVGEAVEGHRRAAGEPHAQQQASQVPSVERLLLPGERGAQQGERQGEDRVAELNHLQDGVEAAEHGKSGSRAAPVEVDLRLLQSCQPFFNYVVDE